MILPAVEDLTFLGPPVTILILILRLTFIVPKRKRLGHQKEIIGDNRLGFLW